MQKEIIIKPIGIINTPYKDTQGMPIQGTFEKGVFGTIHLFPKYIDGLKDVAGFSHLILVYHFNRSQKESVTGKPFLEDTDHGIFAIRSPHRPNHIGISIVRLENIEQEMITFSEVDILDGTPLIDIKPYVAQFDHRTNTTSGWIDKHFEKGTIPKRVTLPDENDK
jgi:tRNA-Thr(GGU) m(6)t(6)A37 methyltransferase TsaA